jgi:hypothetical protein
VLADHALARGLWRLQLPLEALAALGEHGQLARNQLVDGSAVEPAEVAIEDEAAISQPEEAQERPLTPDLRTLR